MEETPLCPYCGYSQCGIESHLCPECGKASPKLLAGLPANALLPWEKRIDQPQIWRFLRTIGSASRHYVRYLHALRYRENVPPYQSRRLGAWFALSAMLIPFVVFGVSSMFYQMLVYGFSARLVHTAPSIVLRVAWHTWPMSIWAGVHLLGGIFLAAGIIKGALILTSRGGIYSIALSAVAPALLMLGAIQLLTAWIPTHMARAQSRELSMVKEWIVVCITVVGAPVCCWFALRIVWVVPRAASAAAAILVGVTAWWLWPLIMIKLSEVIGWPS